jgi:hypothetical protein
MADTESPETDARTTGHAWTEGECVNCRVVSPRPWAEPCAESPRADVELTEAERDYFKANLRANLGYRAYVIEDTMVRHVERILADRLAAVQAEQCQRAKWCRNAMALWQQIDTHTQRDTETAAQALREAADRMPAFHDRDAPEWAITTACKWLRARADSLATGEES